MSPPQRRFELPSLTDPAERERLVGVAADASRSTARQRVEALRASAWPIVQTALAASLAWLVATKVVGHPQPFFAPVSAVICLGVTIGQRGRRAVEVAVGVSLGILVADLFVLAIGTGTIQVGVVIALAMLASVLVGGQQLLVTQAAVSAALVATLQPPDGGIDAARAIDALVGGSIGVMLSLLFPVEPMRRVLSAAEPVFEQLADALREIAAALESRDLNAAEQALLAARAIDEPLRHASDTLVVADEITRFSPRLRKARVDVARWRVALDQLDLAVRNTRVLARGAIRAVGLDENVPPPVEDALGSLADAVESLQRATTASGEEAEEARGDAVEHARAAAATATRVLEGTGNLSVSVIVGQVRSTAVDLLRGIGMGTDTAIETVRQAAAGDQGAVNVRGSE